MCPAPIVFFLRLRLGRPLLPPLGPHVQVIRTNQLEHGIVLDGPVILPRELIPVQQLGQKHLHFLQRKVEPDAHARTCRKGDIRRLVAVAHRLGVPAIRIKASWVVPDSGIVVDVVQGRNDDRVGGDLVTAGQDHGDLGSPGGLVGGVVAALSLLDEFVQEGEFVGDVGGDLGVGVDIVVDQFLQESVLHALVVDEGVDQPGEERAGRGEAGTRGDHESLHEAGLGQFLALVVGGADGVV